MKLIRLAWIPLLLALSFLSTRSSVPAIQTSDHGPILTEFMAADESVLPDGEGHYSGWIEIYNPGPADIDLGGWYLTDDEQDLRRWRFPPTRLLAQEYLVVFASGKGDAGIDGELHTGFRLVNDGGYLALVHPDGDTVAWEYGPRYLSQFEGVSYGLVGVNPTVSDPAFAGSTQVGPERAVQERYLVVPTPGWANESQPANLGPILSQAHHGPDVLHQDDNLHVGITVEASAAPIEAVTLHSRVMYGPTYSVPMADNEGDGVYAATIPSALYGPGDMVRYFITARDGQGHTSRWPLYHDPLNSPQYLGTMVVDPSINSALPVLYWFVQDPYAATTDEGTRASVFYTASQAPGGQRPSMRWFEGQPMGVLYDNVLVRRRGVTSKSWYKKSYKFDFNQGHHLLYAANQPPVEEINLMSTYDDKAYIRQPLAWETYRDAGVPHCVSFTMRVQQNSAFHSVAIFVEQPGPRYLERQGLDPNGALYKVRLNSFDSSTKGLKKVTRLDEGHSDLQAVMEGVHLTGEERTHYLFDHLNLPSIVNYMAATTVIGDRDWGHKNYYIYRDTEGTGEWTLLAWDKDLSFGRHYLDEQGGTFNDVIWADHDPESHPLKCYQESDLIDALLDTPPIREMYLRRLRTLMDQFLQPPDTPPARRIYEARIEELYAQMAPDVLLDASRWPVTWGVPQEFRQALDIFKSEYLEVRRVHLYETHGLAQGGVIPTAQPRRVHVDFGPLEPNPASGDSDEEYLTLVNPNDIAVDLSGWRIAHDVEYTFAPGAVVPAGGTLYLSPNVVAFRRRAVSPTGGEGLFVQGDYRGRLSNRWGILALYDTNGRLVARKTFFAIRDRFPEG